MTSASEIAAATSEMQQAVETYGMPVWYVKVSITKQRIVPLDVRRSLLAAARPSDGWVNQNGCWYKGRLDARETLRQWAAQNLYAVMTVREIADAAGVPQTAVRTMISERADIFRKSDGRTYEVRDPNADRQADKR
jgi:hypothetical protein